MVCITSIAAFLAHSTQFVLSMFSVMMTSMNTPIE